LQIAQVVTAQREVVHKVSRTWQMPWIDRTEILRGLLLRLAHAGCKSCDLRGQQAQLFHEIMAGVHVMAGEHLAHQPASRERDDTAMHLSSRAATRCSNDIAACRCKMMAMTTPPHTSTDFEQELKVLGERLATMGARAETQIALAVRAVMYRNDAVADDVIAGDAAINQDEKEIDAEALQLLARRQPVAGDLRFIAMCLKAVTDLERIGDLAVNTAQRARELNRMPVPAWHFALEPLAVLVTRTLHATLDSLVGKDANAAEQIIHDTSRIDRAHANLLAELLAYVATNPATITWVLPLTSVCRYLGRVGDHIRSLAGEIIYVVRNEHVRNADV
jgi:phosphate transport system protein